MVSGSNEYNRTDDDGDWWRLTVVGYPAQQRHESGKGFKPVQPVLYDYNSVHWLDKPLGMIARWVPQPDSVTVGDVLFVYEPEGEDSFGFLYRVTEVGERPLRMDGVGDPTRAFTVELVQPAIRYQAAIPKDEPQAAPVDQWAPQPAGYQSCEHLSPATGTSASLVATVRCERCA